VEERRKKQVAESFGAKQVLISFGGDVLPRRAEQSWIPSGV